MKQKKFSLFYKVLLGLLILLLAAFCYIRFGLLRPWLTRYEASQPKYASQEVFQDLFSPADWDRVFEAAGLEGNRERFVQSMEELTAGRELTLVETSAGLSGDRRYLVKAGEDRVAAFTLTGGAGGQEPAWKLGSVELLLNIPPELVRVRTLAGQRVWVDGKELGEEFRIQTTEQAAERYLPEGVQGRRTVLWEAPGTEASVRNERGEEVPLTWDEAGGCYAVEETEEEPTDQERGLLLGAAKAYARYMIRASDSAQLQKYFDRESDIYQTIRSSEIWIKQTAGHSFSREEISEFCRYGEDIFSARVSMHMDVKRGNGSQKPYEVDSTFFFRRKNGVWRAFEMTNADVRRETVHTRLVFMDGEEELERLFVSSEEQSFVPPAVSDRPGQRFVGWAVREQEGASVTMTVVFRPGEDGTVRLPAGHVPEPVTLYAVFESE